MSAKMVSVKSAEVIGTAGKRTSTGGEGSLHRARTWAVALAVFAIAAIGTLSACGGGGSGSTTVRSVAISPSTATVAINTQTDFVAVVTLTDSTTSTTTTLTWEVNGVANGSTECGTIAPSTTDQLVGVYTAPAAVPSSSCGSTSQLGAVSITAVAQ